MNTQHGNLQAGRAWVVYGLIVLGVISRLVPHPWNATPVMAIALLSGAYLSRRWSILLPLTIIVLSDLLIGWHNTIPFTWSAFVFTGVLGWWVRQRPTAWRIIGSSLIGSVLFFIVTNFGVWVVGELYPRTAAGFWECYVAAIPFFRGTLLGDLVYVTVFFGTYHLVTRPHLRLQQLQRM